MKRVTLVAVACLGAVAAIAATGATSATAAQAADSSHGTRTAVDTTSITIDGSRPGPTFDGIGAVSGGGGDSRLLIDYPPAQRNAILDYLFKPNFGASLQILKLEIGGDANTSDGAEPSVEHAAGVVNCKAGYEFWLARQAVARNPHIKLYALQWAAPGWVGAAWSTADITYLLDWLRCAKAQGLRIDYLGGWNERYPAGSPAVENWFVRLRRRLDGHGFASVKIVAADANSLDETSAWSVADDMLADTAFSNAVQVVGVHDTCGHPTSGFDCLVTDAALELESHQHKALWESELGAIPATGTDPYGGGPPALARSINNAFIDGGITGVTCGRSSTRCRRTCSSRVEGS